MIRFLFVVLAMVVTVVAFLMQESWLYLVAFLLLLSAVIVLVMHFAQKQRRQTATAIPTPELAQDELRTHGIVDVRPKPKEDAGIFGRKSLSPKKTSEESPASKNSSYAPQLPPFEAPETTPKERRSSLKEEPEKATKIGVQDASLPLSLSKKDTLESSELPTEATLTTQPQPVPKPLTRRKRTMLEAYLEAVKMAFHAHTVCFVHVDREAGECIPEEILSGETQIQRDHPFPIKTALLDQLDQGPCLFHAGGDLDPSALGYYTEPRPSIGEVIIVPLSDDANAADNDTFLFVDRLDGAPAFSEGAPALIQQTAQTLAVLMDAHVGHHKSRSKRQVIAVGKTPKHRQVIRQEMEAAHRMRRPLALALVYFDDHQSLSEDGHMAIKETESKLQKSLEQSVPNGRIEHLGQLGFGVFHYADLPAVETWMNEVHHILETPDFEVEGRLVIGVAMMSDQHKNPEDLQIDAARALQDAYETGENTIIYG